MIGHQKIWDFFKRAAESGKLAHCYLFFGYPGLGKTLFAQNLAKALVCKKNESFSFCSQCRDCRAAQSFSHPDIFFLEPDEKGVIKISRVREMQHQLFLSAHSSKYKIAIVDQAEAVNKESANALLKTLEEPLGQSLIILVSSWPERILPTIVSRCQKIRFSAVRKKELEKELGRLFPKEELTLVKKVSAFSFGRPGTAIRFLRNRDFLKDREGAQKDLLAIFKMSVKEKFEKAQELSKDADGLILTLDAWVLFLRDLLLSALDRPDLVVSGQAQKNLYSVAKIRDLILKTENARLFLANLSFNSRLILENLFLEF